MKAKEFYDLCKSGVNPLVKMSDNIEDFSFDALDPGFIGQVIEINPDGEGSYRILLDFSNHEEHNRSVALYVWKGAGDEFNKCWMDTQWYPKDGIDSLYIPMGGEVPFEIVSSENELFNEYLSNKNGLTYTNWLEAQLTLARESDSAPK